MHSPQPPPERLDERETLEPGARARLGADVGAALTSTAPLDAQLRACCEALVVHLQAAFARIWVLDEREQVLLLRASAGKYTHIDGAHSRVPVGALKIGLIAKEREPHLTNDVLHDPRVGNKEWAAREKMVAFAGYPLIVDGGLVGVMALFAQHPLTEETLRMLASIANSVAVGIRRKRNDDLLLELLDREQAALREAERQRHRLESLFQQAPAAICMLRGPRHVFDLVNPRYSEIVGGRDLLGKPIREALPDLEGHGGYDILDKVFATGEPFVGQEFPATVVRNEVAEECFFNFVYQPTWDPAGAVEGIVVLAFEVTEQVVARRRAEELTRALEATNRELDQFAYVASHDLKAPLRGIASLSQWVEEGLQGKMDAETEKQMRLLRGRVHRLEALIDGILSYSRAGRTRGKLETVDVRGLLGEVVELLAPDGGATIEIGDGMPTLRIERVPFSQVFLNLLSNAIKHAGRPDVRVRVRCESAGAFYDFSVEDNGPGIDPVFHERIWGIFQTLEARDKVEGTGIGLSVVKKICESRGGRVSLDSKPGSGSVFHVFWPKQPLKGPGAPEPLNREIP